jgi:two-component system heavy metal sensor histidine kinase CusS
MKGLSFRVKAGVYAALLTMTALVAGCCVMMVTLYFFQIAELDQELAEDAGELFRDLENFRDAPEDPEHPLTESFIPVPLREHYLTVEGPSGKVVYQSSNLRGSLPAGAIGQTRTETLFGQACRVGAWKEGPYIVRIGARMHMIQRFMKNLGIGFATALPAVGLVVFFGGLWLGRRTVAPVAQLSAAAEKISASNPRERLPMPAARDEIAKLTEVVNRSFDRLQSSYEVATRFSADASHQLKTPVAIMRAGLDHLAQDTQLNETQAAEVATLRQQTRRLTSLIEDLLLLAQADAGRMFLQKEEIDLNLLVQAACEDLQILVSEKKISVEEAFSGEIPILADCRLLAMVMQNLIENAAKYTPCQGVVRIRTFADESGVGVRIANTGKEISGTDKAHIFERFRRGSDIGGNVRGHGLGLNIARELVRAHGGEVLLVDSAPGWITFEMRLPAIGGNRA